MGPKIELENDITIQDIHVQKDPCLRDSYIFDMIPAGTDTPVASMRLMATENLIFQHIPASQETLHQLEQIIEKGNHIYTGSVVSYQPNNGYGLAVWKMSEKQLLEKQGHLVRYITDKSPAFWTTRHLDQVLEYLSHECNARITIISAILSDDTPEYLIFLEK